MEENIEWLTQHVAALKQKNVELETKITLLIQIIQSREDRIKEIKLLIEKNI